MTTFSSTSEPASSLHPPDGGGSKAEEQRTTIKEEISVDLTKRFLELESQNHRLKDENRKLSASNLELEDKSSEQRRRLEDKEELIIRLKEDAASLAETAKRLEEKWERLKERYETLREGSESGDRKWKARLEKSEEKCWRLEVDNRKLQIDLDDARRGADGIGEVEEKIKLVERLLEERDVTISELVKKNEGLEREKMRIEEELRGRLINLEESVQKWVHLTSSGPCKAKFSGDTGYVMDNLGYNVQDKGNGDLEGSAPKSTSISLLDPKKENLEADEQLTGPVIEKVLNVPESTECDIIQISDSEEEEEEEEEEKQTPSFASPSTAKCSETKRKLEPPSGSAEKQAEAKRCKSKDPNDGKLWETSEKMCEAINADNELCIKSICALYRKHKSLGVWKNPLDGGNKGFKSELADRGVALGKLLTNGDPEGTLKKSVAELQREDPKKGLYHCKFIAKNHHTELFEIYSNNLDPFFLP